MSQHDMEITRADANTGVAMRAAINEALQALASSHGGASAPTKAYADQLWFDTVEKSFMKRNSGNTTWERATPVVTLSKSSNQSIAQDVLTKVTFDAIGINTHNWVSNSRITPTQKGHYLVYGTLCSYEATPSTSGNKLMAVCLVLNGNIIIGGGHSMGVSNAKTSDIMAIIPINGSTDYIECHAYYWGTAGVISGMYAGQVSSGFGCMKLF